MPDVPVPDDASTLCVACGLCCNGALFTDARVGEGERGRIEAAGLEVVHRAGRDRFRLPCRHLDSEAGCTIYEGRFGVCRTFRCALLKKVDSGEVAPAEAHRLVGEAKRLLAATPEGASVRGRHEARQGLGVVAAIENPAERAAAARRYLALAAAEGFLDRHFRNKPLLWKGGRANGPDEGP